MKKIIFIDIDGTLTAQDGSVPKSAQTVIKETRRLGNEVILATGRSLGEITDDILEIGFDGIIGAGGAYVEYKDKILLHKKMNEEDVVEITTFLEENGIGYYLESNDGIFGNQKCIDNITESAYRLFEINPNLFVNKEDPVPTWFLDIIAESHYKNIPYDNINKLSFISIDYPFESVKARYKDKFEVYEATVFEFGPNSGEIGLKDIDKKYALELIMEELDIPVRTYAYGDGLNDVSMFEAVDYSVAMKNARERLKDVSNEVTSIAEEDGIQKSFAKNKLI